MFYVPKYLKLVCWAFLKMSIQIKLLGSFLNRSKKSHGSYANRTECVQLLSYPPLSQRGTQLRGSYVGVGGWVAGHHVALLGLYSEPPVWSTNCTVARIGSHNQGLTRNIRMQILSEKNGQHQVLSTILIFTHTHFLKFRLTTWEI